MFPICDARGEPVGFGGRALGADGPKYKNSPETPIYQKCRLLYGLNWAKGEIVGRGEVVICEGYTDVMAFALAGVPNAVATCGTALADEHFQILKNLARKVVLAYDADAAGQGAAEKWYRWEQRYEIQFQVADLPAGRDPADVWHDDPAELLRAVERAAPFLEFRLDRVLAAADVATLEGRARAAETAAAIVARAPERPGPRPVRHEARRGARHQRRPAARDGGAATARARHVDGRTQASVWRRPAHRRTRSARRPARARRAVVGGARTGARRRLARRPALRRSDRARRVRGDRVDRQLPCRARPKAKGRCTTCSNGSRWRSRWRPTNRRRCARTDGQHRRTGGKCRARGDATRW